MARKERKAPKIHVTSLADLAAFFGVEYPTAKGWSSQGMPNCGSNRWELGQCARWLRSEGPWRQHGRSIPAGMAPDEAALFGEGDTPGLERMRLARAGLWEIELDEKRGNVVSRDHHRNVLGQWAGILRSMGERLVRRFGGDAAEVVNDALDDCARVISGDSSGNGNGRHSKRASRR